MHTQRRTQRGAYLIVASVLLVVLLGFGALALDVGRLFVLRSQMQNGVDAAAVAAAFELSRNSGAQGRAEQAARNALAYGSAFAEVAELLGANISLEFYCAIGSEYDPDPATVTIYPDFCAQADADGDGRFETTLDAQSHYVRVTMDQSVNSDAYSLPLYFLPVLGLFGLNVETQSFLQATATAGRNYNYCEYPPLMLCNPFEASGQRFQDVMNPGEQILLADQGPGSSWAPGDVGFLALFGLTGADAMAPYLADEGTVGCTPPVFTTEPGQMTQRTRRAINTRFDQYYNPGFAGTSSTYPPAPDVIDYPNDQTFRPAPADKFGTGNWDRSSYWTTYHAWQAWGPSFPLGPPGYATMTRFDMYEWEIDNGFLPSQSPLIPYPPGTDDTTYDGIPNPNNVSSGTVKGRRVLNAAVVNCTAQNLAGRQTFTMFGQEGFAKMFLTKAVEAPPNRQIWGEYLGWSTPGADANILVDVQLYE